MSSAMRSDNPRLRLGIIGIVIVSLFAALFARLWYLQILMTIALTNDMTDVSQHVDQARVSSIEQQMNQSRDTVPTASQAMPR